MLKGETQGQEEFSGPARERTAKPCCIREGEAIISIGRHFRWPSLRARLSLAFGTLALAVILAVGAVVIHEVWEKPEAVRANAETRTRELARIAEELLDSSRRGSLSDSAAASLLNRLAQGEGPQTDKLVIMGRDQRILAPESGSLLDDRNESDAVANTLADGQTREFVARAGEGQPARHRMVAPLLDQGGMVIGALVLDFERELAASLAEVHAELWWFAALGLAIAIAAALAAAHFSRALLAPLGSLTLAVEALAKGGDARVELGGRGDEIDQLAETFNALAGELRKAQTAAAQNQQELALAVENLDARNQALAQSAAQLDARVREARLRNEMSDLLHSCLNMGEIGAVIIRYLPQFFSQTSGAVYQYNSGNGHLAAIATWGRTPSREAFALADCWALRRGRAHLYQAGGEAMPCAHVAEDTAQGTLCVPLTAHGDMQGLLHFSWLVSAPIAATPAREHGSDFVDALGAQAGMAIANLRLRESLREQSIRDPLTGLYNRRYLEESTERELARALREGRSLAVFMIDVDHFKRYNDSYGHEAGDIVLRMLARILRESCRAGDLACRFGGEEFAVVLPGAPLPAAAEWGERLLGRVHQSEARLGATVLPRITVSVGLAVFPTHGEDRETLLQAADLALYQAKNAGRDRLVISGAEP